MASIIIPGKWTEQPHYPTGIDRNNPLCRGLKVAYNPASGHDAARGIALSLKPARAASPYGISAVGDGTNYAQFPSLPAVCSNSFTLFAITKIGDNNTIVANENDWTNQWRVQIYPSGASLLVNGMGDYNIGPKTNFENYAKLTICCDSGVTNGTRSYCNGNLIITNTVTMNTLSGNYPFTVGSKRYIPTPNSAGNDNALVLFWDRPLNAAEVLAINTNPYQVFQKRPQILYFDVASGGATTLTADTGTFTLTGQAVNLTATRKLTADAATFTLTGQSANLLAARRLTADTGAFALTGNDATLTKTTVGAFTMTADTGAFTLTGQAAGLTAQRKVSADAVAFTLTGVDATLTKTTVGAFTLTAEAGTFTYTGQAANLLATRRIAADVGTFTLTGNAATLTKTTAGAYNLTCETASFAVTASAAGLIATRVMPAVTGSFALTGNAAAFVYGRAVVAEPGSFALTGNDATLRAPARLVAESGFFTLTGNSAALIWSAFDALGNPELIRKILREQRIMAVPYEQRIQKVNS